MNKTGLKWAMPVVALLTMSHAGYAGDDAPLDVAAELPQGPSGMTFTPEGGMVISLHPCFSSRERVVRIDRNGERTPFATGGESAQMEPGASQTPALDSVMGVQAGSNGIVWMVDNGRRSETVPKLVGWNLNSNRIHRIFYLPAPATIDTSFLADIAVDPLGNHVFISDPASGSDAAIIVVDLRTGLPRRVLQGHDSVKPENIPFVIRGKEVSVRRPDGSSAEPLTGVNPIAIDRKGRWLYYGPMKGEWLFRIDAELLRNPDRKVEEIAAGVELYSRKPVCDSIAIDARNNIYVADIPGQAISVIGPDGDDPRERKPAVFLRDPKLCWPDGLCFGNDQKLYFYCSQINLTGWFNGGRDQTHGPFRVYRVKPMTQQQLLGSPLPKRNPFTTLGEQISERFGLD